ncbi:MAG: hypothetical protein ACTSR2_10360 [Candidatus Hodarchaeales archaeon]
MSEVNDNMDYTNYLEFYFPLSEWFQHFDTVTDIQRGLKERAESFDILMQYKRKHLISVRYTLCTPGCSFSGPTSLYVTNCCKRVVLLDFGVDSPELIKELSQLPSGGRAYLGLS